MAWALEKEQIELQMASCRLWEMEEIPSVPTNTQQLLVAYPKDGQGFYACVLTVSLDTDNITNSENLVIESSLDISALKWP